MWCVRKQQGLSKTIHTRQDSHFPVRTIPLVCWKFVLSSFYASENESHKASTYWIYNTNAEQEKHSKCLQFVPFDQLLGLEHVVYDEGQFHLSRLLLVIRERAEGRLWQGGTQVMTSYKCCDVVFISLNPKSRGFV